MSLSHLTESNNLPVSPLVMCPFLGEFYDSTTYSANDVVPNYCHKARPVAPVNIDHQILVCLSGEYKNCIVYNNPKGCALPAEWLNKEEATPKGLAKWRTAFIYTGIGLIFVIVAVFLLRGLLFGTSAARSSQVRMTASPTAVLLVADTIIPTGTPMLSPTRTPTPILSPTIAQTETQDPSLLTQTAAALLALTQQNQTATSTDPCTSDWANQLTLQVFDPQYSPIHTDPPQTIIYDSLPFLIRWQVQNTSKNCIWNVVQLQTIIYGQNKILTLMLPDHIQPTIDVEFAMRDQYRRLVSQVNPGQTVTITIQIDGIFLMNSYGKIDKSLDLLVNGHLLPAGTLKASLLTWAIVVFPDTETPTPQRSSPPPTPPINNPPL